MKNQNQGIISIQSHVAYGYVGNKAATYPLQYLGYDVWPIHTLQFSNHTGYGKWRGDIFESSHIKEVAQGIIDLGKAKDCRAIISGYMGSEEICNTVHEIVLEFKKINKDIIYLCDPVMGGAACYVRQDVQEFFRTKLNADIITPNHHEAEILSNSNITELQHLKKAALYFHKSGIKIVVFTGLILKEFQDKICTFASDEKTQYLMQKNQCNFNRNGTGDLFSALYIANYIKEKSISSALAFATNLTHQALEESHEEGELQVTKIKYDIPTHNRAQLI